MTVFWRAFFFQVISLRLTPFVHLSIEVRCCISHSTVCSWLGVVWAMMFNRGILFYSKWPFRQSQQIKERQTFSFVNSSSLDWVNMKGESSSKVHQRGARMPGQRRAGQLVPYIYGRPLNFCMLCTSLRNREIFVQPLTAADCLTSFELLECISFSYGCRRLRNIPK